MADRSLRVLGNIRLSHLTEETTSPERQREQIEGWTKIHGHEMIGWAEHLNVSGGIHPLQRTKRDGKGLAEWMTDGINEWDILVSAKLDRLSRKLFDIADVIRWSDEHGKSIATVSESIDTGTPMGRFLAKILGIIAEFELDRITERILEGHKKIRETDNRHAGGPPPYWLQPAPIAEGKGLTLVLDHPRSEVVKEIVRRVTEGESVASVLRDFDSRGVDNNRRFYRQNVISRILRNRALIGEKTHFGEPVIVNGKPVTRCEPLLTYSQWRELQLALDRAAAPKGISDEGARLLSSLLCCGLCGRVRHYKNQKVRYSLADGTDVQTYILYSACPENMEKLKSDPSRCPARLIQAEQIEKLAERVFLDLAGGIEAQEPKYHPADDPTEELQRLIEVRDYYLSEITKVGASAAKGYQSQLDALNARIDQLSAQPAQPARTEWVGAGMTYSQLWGSTSSIPERRKMLQAGGFRFYILPIEDGEIDTTWQRVLEIQKENGYGGFELGRQTTGRKQYVLACFYPVDFKKRLTQS